MHIVISAGDLFSVGNHAYISICCGKAILSVSSVYDSRFNYYEFVVLCGVMGLCFTLGSGPCLALGKQLPCISFIDRIWAGTAQTKRKSPKTYTRKFNDEHGLDWPLSV